MKTNEQILNRALSAESGDFFNEQRTLLMSLLPFSMVKPYLNEGYVEAHENGTIPEDEKWREDKSPLEQLMDFFPKMYKIVQTNDNVSIIKGFLCLKSWIWVLDDEFYKEMELLFTDNLIGNSDFVLKKIADHFGYKPIIEDVEFEETPKEV